MTRYWLLTIGWSLYQSHAPQLAQTTADVDSA